MMDENLEQALLDLYFEEIREVAVVIAGINAATMRAIYVDVIVSARNSGVRNLRPEALRIAEILREGAVDPRHTEFVLGAAILRNRLPEV